MISKVMKLSNRDFISLGDFTAEELLMFWDLATELKRRLYVGETQRLLEGKTLGMIFEHPSTRTRVSFETGIQQLGGHGIFLSPEHFWTKGREELRDTAKVLSRYVHAIIIRPSAYSHEKILELAKWADVPVINACSNYEHPCQVMADFMTTREKKGKLEGVKTVITWTQHPFSIPLGIINSTLFAGSKTGMDVTIACPEGYDPDPEVWKRCQEEARSSGAELAISRDLKEAVDGADVIHIKSWGPPEVFKKGIEEKAPHLLEPKKYEHWKITNEIVELAKRDAIVQHALPVIRGVQATNEVLDGPHSVIYDEAENRLHAQKAIMTLIMR